MAATYPVLQLANFSLPSHRGDFGGGAVELMGAHNIFVSLFEYGPESVGTAAVRHRRAAVAGRARRLRAQPAAAPAARARAAPSGSSPTAGRPFCLYVVLGSYLLRRATLSARSTGSSHTITIT